MSNESSNSNSTMMLPRNLLMALVSPLKSGFEYEVRSG